MILVSFAEYLFMNDLFKVINQRILYDYTCMYVVLTLTVSFFYHLPRNEIILYFKCFLNITMSTARLKISFKLMCQCLKVIKE